MSDAAVLALAEWDWSALRLDWSMRSIYVVCAVVGGAILLIQTGLLLLGFDGGESGFDFDADTDVGDGSFGFLSLRALTSFLAFFGLSGWGALEAGWGRGASLGVAVAAGAAVMVVVVWLLRLQLKLGSSGNIDPANALGKTATVYLRIPGSRTGKGKITVSIQGRTQEYLAVTGGDTIPTGATVRVVSMPTEGTFEVVSLTEE